MATKLPRESFLVLAAIGWADGKMGKDEATALVRAAKAAGLDGGDLEAVEYFTTQQVKLESVNTSRLTGWEAALTYAIGTYVARLDGVVNTDEHVVLKELGKRLGMNEKTQQSATAAAFDVALASGRGAEKYDFAALETKLRERLPSLQ